MRTAIIAILLFLPGVAHAGLCEDQLEIPWRRAAIEKRIPLNKAIELNRDGSVGNGSPNALLDRPFYNAFWGGGWVLFTADTVELFFQTNSQGAIPQCEFPPLIGISIAGATASLTHVLHSKPYMNKSRLSPQAIKLIIEGEKGIIEVLVNNGRRIPIGASSREELRTLYSVVSPNGD